MENFIENISSEALIAIIELDRKFIGTENYMGLAFFWAYAYRHYLREAKPYQRRKVHAKILAAGLNPGGETPAHMDIITSTLKLK